MHPGPVRWARTTSPRTPHGVRGVCVLADLPLPGTFRPASRLRAPGLERAVLICSAGPVSSLMGPGLLFKMFIKMAQLFKHKINEDDPLTLL